MAKYDEYTPEQKEMLDELYKEARIYKRKLDQLITKRGNNPAMTFEEYRTSRKVLFDLKTKYEDTKNEINRVLNAREDMKSCIEDAKYHLRCAQRCMDRAEDYKKTYGFKECDIHDH